jgi:hypothetical protein
MTQLLAISYGHDRRGKLRPAEGDRMRHKWLNMAKFQQAPGALRFLSQAEQLNSADPNHEKHLLQERQRVHCAATGDHLSTVRRATPRPKFAQLTWHFKDQLEVGT